MGIGFRTREIQTYGKAQVHAMDRLCSARLYGIGMTSFGPTLFDFSPDWDTAYDAYEALRRDRLFENVYITTPRNQRAAIDQG